MRSWSSCLRLMVRIMAVSKVTFLPAITAETSRDAIACPNRTQFQRTLMTVVAHTGIMVILHKSSLAFRSILIVTA
jgi:hypothetical protein